jgi:hypothetical protein|nr:MAG TPA: hypothetical protein [Caudoviricetes sp.]
MRLIDAEQINFNDAFIGQSDFARDTREAAERLVKMQAVINQRRYLLINVKAVYMTIRMLTRSACTV